MKRNRGRIKEEKEDKTSNITLHVAGFKNEYTYEHVHVLYIHVCTVHVDRLCSLPYVAYGHCTPQDGGIARRRMRMQTSRRKSRRLEYKIKP